MVIIKLIFFIQFKEMANRVSQKKTFFENQRVEKQIHYYYI